MRETRALTSNPFGVNLNLEFPQDERLDVCLAEKVPVISFFWREPGALVRRAKEAAAIVLHTVASANMARRAVESGVDVVVAQGWEAGGHVRGTVATLPLIPAVVDVVGATPVVAAGGIADGRGLAAVLALGAAGAWIGTRFLASREATIHPCYRERLLSAAPKDDTVFLEELFDVGLAQESPHRVLRVTRRSSHGQPAGRCLRPVPAPARASGDCQGHDRSARSCGTSRTRRARTLEGDIDALSLWAGQSVGLVSEMEAGRRHRSGDRRAGAEHAGQVGAVRKLPVTTALVVRRSRTRPVLPAGSPSGFAPKRGPEAWVRRAEGALR